MLMVKVPHLVFGFWSLAVAIISTSEAAALSPLGEELVDASNEIEQNDDSRYLDEDYDDQIEPAEAYDKRANSFAHALRIRRGGNRDSSSFALRIRKAMPSGFGHALRIKKGAMFNHALRVRNIRASPFTHALRIKKGAFFFDQPYMWPFFSDSYRPSYLTARSSPFTHALRVRRMDPMMDDYFDPDMPKRASSFSHILRVR